MKMTQLYLLVFAIECRSSTGMWTGFSANKAQHYESKPHPARSSV